MPRQAKYMGKIGGVREDELESKHCSGNAIGRRLFGIRSDLKRLTMMLQMDEGQGRMKTGNLGTAVNSRRRRGEHMSPPPNPTPPPPPAPEYVPIYPNLDDMDIS